MEGEKGIRSFLCVELDEVTKKRLARWVRDLSEKMSELKWVNPEGLHVTLKFCGEISPA
ncbi:MAG: RNA 2',3'-cyclic phosphodiesterase, partial [Synergistales bacterium]|nr:RNA 2',3'-cyclic phosphodiesterase [Synergistales bacterium]